MAAPAAESRPAAVDGPRARALLLAAIAACAACGLIYELVLLTLSTGLTGGGITQTSLVVAGYVAALGAGALLVKPFLTHAAAVFVTVEIVLGVLGGLSAVTLYVTFSYYGTSTPVLIGATALLGGLVGAEVPLLMTLLTSGRRSTEPASTGKVLANLNAADYAGALLGGLAWPFLLLPLVGQIRGAALTGLINLVAAAVLAGFLLRHQLSRTARWTAAAALLLAAALLGGVLLQADDIQNTARQRLYADPVVTAEQSAYQQIVLTRRSDDVRLYLDGDLQFSSRDEHRYHEALVHPALSRDPRRVLIVGGGDGLAAREVLRQPSVREVVQVELDPSVLDLGRTRLSGLNHGSLHDPRMRVVVDDAFRWLRERAARTTHPDGFDAVIVDLPDPDTPALGRLYSTEFYGLVRTAAKPAGLVVVQSGSPYSTPTAYWRTVSTIASTGLAVTPYHVHVPSFGDWGFTLASDGPSPPEPTLSAQAPPMQFLDDAVLRAASVFPRDRRPQQLPPSTLDHPHIVRDLRQGYSG